MIYLTECRYEIVLYFNRKDICIGTIQDVLNCKERIAKRISVMAVYNESFKGKTLAYVREATIPSPSVSDLTSRLERY